MLYFGEKWDAPVTDDAERAPTPVGAECAFCPHKIKEGDQGCLYPRSEDGTVFTAFHRGCVLAETSGHWMGVCGCTGWDDTYEAGVEIVRRAEERLKPAGGSLPEMKGSAGQSQKDPQA